MITNDKKINNDNKIKIPLDTQIYMKSSNVLLNESVKEAKLYLKKNPKEVDAWIDYGRELIRQNLYREAIDIYNQGLLKFPLNPYLLTLAGRAYLNIRRYEEAVANFVLSKRIKPDLFDTYYHLGVAYYLLEDNELSLKTFDKTMKLADCDEDYTGSAYWYLLTLMRMDKKEEVYKFAGHIEPGLKLTLGYAFYNVLLIVNGNKEIDDVLKIEDNMTNAHLIYYYGIACYQYFLGNESEGDRLILRILEEKEGKRWAGFAYLGALLEKEKRNLGGI